MKIGIIFYSLYGHVAALAEAVAEGAREVEGAEVEIYQVPETLSDEAAFALVEALYAMVGALESIYFVQIRRHVASLDRSAQPDLFDAPIQQGIEELR